MKKSSGPLSFQSGNSDMRKSKEVKEKIEVGEQAGHRG